VRKGVMIWAYDGQTSTTSEPHNIAARPVSTSAPAESESERNVPRA